MYLPGATLAVALADKASVRVPLAPPKVTVKLTAVVDVKCLLNWAAPVKVVRSSGLSPSSVRLMDVEYVDPWSTIMFALIAIDISYSIIYNIINKEINTFLIMRKFELKTTSADPSTTQTFDPSRWPTKFDKPAIGINLHGTIIEYVDNITDVSQVTPIPGSLDAIRILRLKGYKVFIFADYPGIFKNTQTTNQADSIHAYLMEILGKSGCFSIEGLYYNNSDLKDDIFAKPNPGMYKRASNEYGISWKGGYVVGDSFKDVKVSEKLKVTPVLLESSIHHQEALDKLQSFSNRELKKKVRHYSNLFEFANSL